MRPTITVGVGLALLAIACAPDRPDTYGAPSEAGASSATLPPLPATTLPPDREGPVAGPRAEPATTYPPNGSTVVVRSLDNSFVAAVVEIEAGTEVRWINGGRNDHNVLPVDDELDWGVERQEFTPTDEYAHVFDQPGVFPYYCSIHGTKDVGMVGAIVVTEPA